MLLGQSTIQPQGILNPGGLTDKGKRAAKGIFGYITDPFKNFSNLNQQMTSDIMKGQMSSPEVRTAMSNSLVELMPDIGSIAKVASLPKKAKKFYGTTGNSKEAGYIMPDGEMLDFSGAHQGGDRGYGRNVDHREIGGWSQYMGDDELELVSKPYYSENPYPGHDEMMKFQDQSGAVRWIPEVGGISVTGVPTKAQTDQLIGNVFEAGYDSVRVDIDNPITGDTLKHIEIERPTLQKVMNKIKEVYKSAGLEVNSGGQVVFDAP